MMLEQVKKKLQSWMEKIKKYKYTAIILILGVVFMCVPMRDGEKRSETVQEVQMDREEQTQALERDLEKVLSQVEGMGEVSVLLSVENGFEHSYQQNTRIKTSDDMEDQELETAVVTHEGNDRPVEVKITYPTYRGAVVVCQGADKASVKLAVVRAVSSLTGLSADHITVIKMKGR